MTSPLIPLHPLQSYDDALAFLDGLDVSAMKLGLARIQRLLDTLGNPQDSLPMVHVAGTNGKGSVTAMLGSVLRVAGYTVGTFTSPHLIHVRERIAINGNPILPDDFQEEVNALKSYLEQTGWPREEWPTYFEFLNVMAYRYFKRKGVDITVFETGLGGRLDSTNVVKHPNLTVITTIGMDHMQHLGDTLGLIAAEKAGILKAGTPLVLGDTLPAEARLVILEKAASLEVPVITADSEGWSVEADSTAAQGLHLVNSGTGQNYWLALSGPYQKSNLALVDACVRQLRQQGFVITEEAVAAGLRQTCWPVRFQYFERQHLLLDGSHNPEGFHALREGLRLYFSNQPMAWLVSLRANRDPQPLLELIREFGPPVGIIVTWAQPNRLYHSPDALAAGIWAAVPDNCPVQTAETPMVALSLLKALMADSARCSDGKPLGVVTGSLYTAGEVLQGIERPEGTGGGRAS